MVNVLIESEESVDRITVRVCTFIETKAVMFTVFFRLK